MKNRNKLIACGASALFAAVLCVQAQSSTSPSQSSPSTTTPPPVRSDDTSIRYSSDPKNQTKSQSGVTATQSGPDTLGTNRTATTPDTSTRSSTTSAQPSTSGQSSTSGSTSGALSSSSTTFGAQSAMTASTKMDTQVTTIVQEIDQQGPMIVERVATQFADVSCSEANARKLVEALHSGNDVTLIGEDGKSVTFKPTGTLGYGEAYIAMALAAETLKQNGITGCATPDQWRSVLIGGPLSGSTSVSSTTSASSSSSASANFPGILVLRTQGQGWGQIAQTSNVQMSSIMTTARTSLNLSESSSSSLGSSSSEMDKSGSSTTKDSNKDASTQPKDDKSGSLGATSGSSGASSYSTDKSSMSPRNPNAYEKSSNAQDKSANSDHRNANATDKTKVNDSKYKWNDPTDPKNKDPKKKDPNEPKDDSK